MSTESNQPYTSAGLSFFSQEQDDSASWITVEEWGRDLAMPTNDSFYFPELESSHGMNEPGLGSSDPLFFGNTMDWVGFNLCLLCCLTFLLGTQELPLLEPGFESMENRIDLSSDSPETTSVEEGIFNFPSSLELNYPDFASLISDGSSWEMSTSPPPTSLSPQLSLVSSHDDSVSPRTTILIDNSGIYAPPEGPGASPVASIPSNEAPTPSCTKVSARAPRSSVRDRELATHNVRVNPQELKDKLTERGHGDKIEALDGLLDQIDEFITFRQIYGHDRDTRSRISPPEALGAPHFAPFLQKRHKSDRSHTNKKTLFYACSFCDHELSNRTQMVQHLMARHFRYFPHECHEWYVIR
jgi:hypothetical protein